MKAATVKVELDEDAAPAAPLETAEQSDPPTDADSKAKVKPPAAEPPSAVMKQIALEEERSLKEWLDTIGTQGAFRVSVARTEPKYVNVRGRGQVKCDGFLRSYDHVISEEDIQRDWGGGNFQVKVMRPGKNGGSMQYQRGLHRSLQIAGDPSTDNLPGGANTTVPTDQPAVAPENATVTKELASLVKEMVHDRDRGEQQRGIDPAIKMLLDQQREQLAEVRNQMATREREMAELRREASAAPPGDPLKDQILSSMIQGRDGQVEAIKVRTESELRMAKESAIQEVKRLEDRHDREIAAMRQSHEQTMATLKSSYDREIAAMRHSAEVALTATKATFDVQVHTLNAEVKRLERDVAELRTDNRELRERKEKGILEQLTEMKKIKEAFGGDEEESSTMDKVMAAAPALIEQVGRAIASKQAGAAPAQAQAPAVQGPPQIYRSANGQRVILQGGKAIPIVRKPKVVKTDDGTAVVAPVVEPNQVAMLVSYLEGAYKGGQDPGIVAQSGRSHVPEEVLKWIRENDNEQVSGVDLFMRRVANLSSTSPLSTQSGRNWLRKVGKELVGDDSGGE